MAELDDKVIVTKSKITDIADALREEMSESYEYSLPTMVEKVHELGQGQGSEYTAGVGIDITNRVVSVVDTLMIRGESSGSIASIDDGADDIPLKSCIVAIEPVQSGSGDPSPSNVRAISGWTECNITVCGTNLFDKDNAENGYIDDSTGEVKAGGGDSKNTGYIKVVPSSSLYIISEQASGMWGAFYDKNKQYISGVTGYANSRINVPNNAYYMRLTVRYSGSGKVNTFAINYPSTGTSYYAYTGQTYNIQFPSQAGIVYGCKLDAINGVLVVTNVKVGELNWASQSTETQKSYYSEVINNIKIPTSATSLVGAISSDYTEVQASNFQLQGDGKFAISQSKRINVNDNRYATVQDFTNAMNNISIVYELATPITYQLTPTEIKTLLGINNIFADCGDVDVEYVRDATLIINKLLELVSGNNNRTMMKSAVVEKTDEVQEQKKDSVEEDLDA